VDDVELGVEARGVNDLLAAAVFGFEKHVAVFSGLRTGFGRRDGDGVAEEVADVAAEFEERFVGGVFGFFYVFEAFCGFGAEAR